MKQESLDNETFNSIIEDCMISITQVDEASKLLCLLSCRQVPPKKF